MTFAGTALPAILVLILQLHFLPLLSIGGILPDPVLIWLLGWSPGKKDAEILWVAFLMGLAIDLPAGALPGLHSLAYLLAVWYFRRFIPSLKSSGFLLGSFHMLLPLLFYAVVYYFISLSSENFHLFTLFWKIILPSVLYNWVLITTWRGFRS